MKHILIVDDEPFISDVLRRILEANGYRVHAADSWDKGAETYRDSDFDLVLMDVVMPGISGFEAAKKIKAVHPEQKIVLLTGLGPGVAEEAIRDHDVVVEGYLFKPFTYQGVMAMLENVLMSDASIAV